MSNMTSNMTSNMNSPTPKYPTKDELLAATNLEDLTLLNDWEREAWMSIHTRAQLSYVLSAKQIALWWKLYAKLQGKEDKPQAATSDNFYPNTVAFLSRANVHIQRPQLTIGNVRIRRNSPSYSRFPNDYTVSNPSTSTYYCAIRGDNGQLILSRGMNATMRDEVLSILNRIEADPLKAILSEAADNCIFCNRELDNPASRAAHYGPTCAAHYGLPWGEKGSNKEDWSNEEELI